MPFKAPQGSVSPAALQTAAAAAPALPRLAGDTMGEAGSRDALAQLNSAMSELKAIAIQPLLQRAVDAIHSEDWKTGLEWAGKALEKDKSNGFAWYLTGIAYERAGDFAASIGAYETALTLIPDHAQVANDLGRLAFRMGMPVQAEKFFRHFLAAHPGHVEGVNNLACALRGQRRFDDAIEVLRPAIINAPGSVQLWNTMGTVVAEQGDYPNAEIFFQEVLRLDPEFHKGLYNLGNARLALGDAAGALEANEAALARVAAEDERQMIRLSRSTILIALGRIREGWDEYEARLHPQFSDTTHFLFDRPRWEPGADLAGKSLLVCAEQGLGDEILFSNVLPDIVERLGPEGRLTLAVEPRLVELFQRTYPQARVGYHATYDVGGKTIRYAPFLIKEMEGIDLWAPMASLLREYRRTVESFPARAAFITPDPARVAHWKRVLEEQAPPGPKVGLLWKSASDRDARHRYFSPFEAWEPVLQTRGVSFVNLQYGDCAEELAQAERDFGARIWTPPGIDLKQDLDDVAALGAALDLVVGFSNASFNLAAAGGTPVWLISTPGSWPRLGTLRYPWYPQARVFMTPTFGAWDGVMGAMAEALGEFAAKPR